MLYAEIEGLLQQTMGLDAASIGSSVITHAVEERLAACHLRAASDYLKLLRTSTSELQALIEAVVVPETWFFREPEAFRELARLATQHWLLPYAQGPLRFLSLPCSSGEEPYSMAMGLLDAGVSPSRFHIDAMDISARALARAREAVYRRNSFRGEDPTFRDRYFEPGADGFRLGEAVRRCVQFQQRNLSVSGAMSGIEPYDAIFCRNLLIYFDRATQDRVVSVLDRLLKPSGVLFVGPAEGGLLLSHRFVSSKTPCAFAFRRSEEKLNAAGPALPGKSPATSVTGPSVTIDAASVLRPKEPTAARSSAGLAEALILADQGHLADAVKACRAHLLKSGPSAPAFHLMGLIRSATGNPLEAREFYRQALYLDPHHEETLAHLRVLLEGEGDVAGAQLLQDRLERIHKRRTA
jgi:chemotaxis protein methyltransferase WspC